MTDLLQIAGMFNIAAAPETVEPYGCGHINDTYLVCCGENKYILQRINENVFPNVEMLMGNIERVTSFLAETISDKRRVLTLVKAKTGDSYVKLDSGCYRMYIFIEDTTTYQIPESPAIMFGAGAAFGSFQKQLAGFDASKLGEVIPNFHNTASRFADFEAALKNNKSGRAENAKPEIEYALSLKEDTHVLLDLLKSGELPLRVTHNDTKINNVLFDPKTSEGICVIDLDTVMPGLSLYDFGDSIRSGANSADEDEKDLSKVNFDMDMFREYARGYFSVCGDVLTDKEAELMPFAAMLMTYECGIRFLADYIDGDTYFKTKYPEHNLVRCRTQFKLVQDMKKRESEMSDIIASMRKK